MSFRIINPGFAECCDYRFTETSKSCTTFDSDTYNPHNKKAIGSNANKDWSADIKLPNQLNLDLYVKFDLFIDYSNCSFRIGHYTGTTNNNINWVNGAQVYYNNVYINYKSSRYGKGIPLVVNKVNSIWFHIFSDGLSSSETNTFFELIVNNSADKEVTNFQYSSDFFNYNYNAITIFADKHCFLSNLIISDSFIDPREKVTILPLYDSEEDDTNMSFDSNNLFTASQDRQYARFYPDLDDLISAFGADSTVTALSFCPVPAFKSGDVLNSLNFTANIDDEYLSTSLAISDDSLSGSAAHLLTNCSLDDIGSFYISAAEA